MAPKVVEDPALVARIVNSFRATGSGRQTAKDLGHCYKTVVRVIRAHFTPEQLAQARRRVTGLHRSATPVSGPVVAPTPVVPVDPVDPVLAAQERLERNRLLHQERDVLYAVAGEKSLRAELARLARETARAFPPPPPYRPPVISRRASVETAVLNLSDWHAYEVVKKERTQGFNEYNAPIFARRAKRVVDETIKIRDRMEAGGGWAIPDIIVSANGDFISGTIHEVEKHTDAPHVMAAAYGCAYTLALAIRDLAGAFRSVVVFCTAGNHGRLPDQKRMSQKDPTRNWDSWIYLLAEALLKDLKNVKFVIPDSYVLSFEIGSKRFVQYHGHGIKCFPPDTPVRVSPAEERPIGEFAEGDEVLDGFGRPSRVTGVHRYDFAGELVAVAVDGLDGAGFRCTPTHKVRCVKPHWIRNGVIPEPEWVPAKWLSVGDYLAVPKPYASRVASRYRQLETEHFVLVPIAGLQAEPYRGQVVDLSVADDSSFLVNYLSVHNSWNQIPHYGIARWTRGIQALRSQTLKPVDYFLISHFHSESEMPASGGKTFINGSLIGGTEFSVNELGVCDPPLQKLFFVSDPIGINSSWPIYGEVEGEARRDSYPAYPWVRE